MGRALPFLLALLLLSGCCENSGSGDDVKWAFRFDGGETTTSGGGTVVVTNALTVADPWLIGEAEPLPGPLPPIDAEAIADALGRAPADHEILDAVASVIGPVALLRGPDGGTLLGALDAVPWNPGPAPDGATRLVPADDPIVMPLRVWIVLGDGLAALATRQDP